MATVYRSRIDTWILVVPVSAMAICMFAAVAVMFSGSPETWGDAGPHAATWRCLAAVAPSFNLLHPGFRAADRAQRALEIAHSGLGNPRHPAHPRRHVQPGPVSGAAAHRLQQIQGRDDLSARSGSIPATDRGAARSDCLTITLFRPAVPLGLTQASCLLL